MENLLPFLCRYLPPELAPLIDLALDVRWTWNHGSDRLWQSIEPQIWEKTRNPWWILQSLSQKRMAELISDKRFQRELKRIVTNREEYLNQPGWYGENHRDKVNCVAYFSMEFGLGEEIPLYAGGLGILSGDHLKTASDLNVPLVAVGLLYQEGYFRQILADDGSQITANPHNDPTNLPMRPVTDPAGGWLRVPVELPGRRLMLRVWQVQVGHILLYLLDSNDPMNDPADRSLIYKLYDERPEFRIIQEIALGIGGWRALSALGRKCQVCHLNEGHAAFVILERARNFMEETGVTFPVALWATRGGNVFTTHTAVAAGFDVFPPHLVRRYFNDYAMTLNIEVDQILALGRQTPDNQDEPFNMAILASRGCSEVNAVSRLHEDVSKRIFQPWYPRWPEMETPVTYVTNGVHMPSWDSQWADEIWMSLGGKGCWCRQPETLTSAVQNLPDDQLWELRSKNRQSLVDYVRRRLSYQFRQYSADSETMKQIQQVLDPDVLTIGFARRFATYKRPDLLLRDAHRLTRLLVDSKRPIQLIVAGKSHPKDADGANLVREMVRFARKPEIRHRMVFLPDYDIQVAQQLVQGVDVWVNTPRRPWEACGTSGMKVLVNGGLNLSELDGWWAEAYTPEVGWAIGDGHEHDSPEWDAVEAEQLYGLLEEQIIPEFYNRDSTGIPKKWINRVRSSMSLLCPNFSSNRMLRDYVNKIYLPASARWLERTANNAGLAKELNQWQKSIERNWGLIKFNRVQMLKNSNGWDFEAEINLGEMQPDSVQVQIYADQNPDDKLICQTMSVKRKSQSRNFLYNTSIITKRPAEHFSMRIIPAHPAALVPLEEKHILWKYPLYSS